MADLINFPDAHKKNFFEDVAAQLLHVATYGGDMACNGWRTLDRSCPLAWR
jgi:hypothetical protein